VWCYSQWARVKIVAPNVVEVERDSPTPRWRCPGLNNSLLSTQRKSPPHLISRVLKGTGIWANFHWESGIWVTGNGNHRQKNNRTGTGNPIKLNLRLQKLDLLVFATRL